MRVANNRITYLIWVLPIFYAAFLFYLSSRPIYNVYMPFLFFDKVVHILLYFVFGITITIALYICRGKMANAVYIGGVYGFLDEVHQIFVPTRSFDILDWVADVIGILLAVFIFCRLKSCHYD